jgi:hypothetical protein
MSLPEPTDDHKRYSGKVQEPSDDDEDERRSVLGLQRVARETVVRDTPADHHEEERDGRKERREELGSALCL